ncbi:hypothetical protein FB45DRAFT_1041738 [Roridomyces roridus]|uniref:CCHC-type domain-containing protein n=1 Tax=Roridomyces roridus TaxID=1738132 RepID=A0AAD7F6Z1_9AGAR|nr:hypothetical protein FB45DRAFT_1041738 [Roridomyces roridus]
MSTGHIQILPAEKQLGDDNWGSWKEIVISLLRGKGVDGYPLGKIRRPGAPVHPTIPAEVSSDGDTTPTGTSASAEQASLSASASQIPSSISAVLPASTTTSVNSLTPSLEEWLLRDAMAGAIIYQNVKDPAVHGLSAADTSREMWVALHGKFDRKTEVVKGLRMAELRSVKLDSGRNLLKHLDDLARARARAVDAGCRVYDIEMIGIILQSLPAAEFGPSIIALQTKAYAHEVVAELRQYHDIVYGREPAPGTGNNALAVAGRPTCSNCSRFGHGREQCFARGGGREGYAPSSWRPPRGKEPRKELTQAARDERSRQVQTALVRLNAEAAALAASTPTAPTSTYEMNHGAAAARPPAAAYAAFAAPTAMYVLGSDDEADGMDIEGKVLGF